VSEGVVEAGRVLFVCTANVCRSPMAEAMFDALAADAGLELRAESAGTAALKGQPAAPKTREVLAELGIPSKPGHRARQVDRRMVGRTDLLVLTMTPEHVRAIERLTGGPSPNVHTLAGYASGMRNEGIADPYGHGLVVYRACARQLFDHLERLVDGLSRGAA